MRDKQIKLIYFSLNGSEGKELVLTWRKLLSVLFSAFVVLLLLVGSIIALFTDYYHNYRINKLTDANRVLTNHLDFLSANVGMLEKRVKFLEKENDDLSIFADMPRIDADTRKVGVGGSSFESNNMTSINLMPEFMGKEATAVRKKLEQLERRVQLYQDERSEIEVTLAALGDELDHRPSIRPVMGGRVSDGFGFRRDPFTGSRQHHGGLDISIERGTDVYATAAGKVVYAKKHYSVNRGYGKEIVIDHGNGLKTRYAHLSKVFVDYGQKVDRWTVIGKVGNTGRSTAPHLHYEVIAVENRVNPMNHILNN